MVGCQSVPWLTCLKGYAKIQLLPGACGRNRVHDVLGVSKYTWFTLAVWDVVLEVIFFLAVGYREVRGS